MSFVRSIAAFFVFLSMHSFCNLTDLFFFLSLASALKNADIPQKRLSQPSAAVASFACVAFFILGKEAIRSIIFLRSLCNDDCSLCVVFPSQSAF